MKRILRSLVITIVLLLFPLCIEAHAAPRYTYTYEGNNALGVAVRIKSESFIKGKVKVTFYLNGKKYKTRTAKFDHVKDNIIEVEGPGDWSYGLTGTEKYKVKVYGVKKQKGKDARESLKVTIKRKPGIIGDDVIMTIKNTSNKPIKYNGTLLMRYAGKDAFGVDCTGQFYDMESKSGTIKPGKKVKIRGGTWPDYKITSVGLIDAYYAK